MYMLNMVIILIVMYCNVVTAIDKIPTYLLRFNRSNIEEVEASRESSGSVGGAGSRDLCLEQGMLG